METAVIYVETTIPSFYTETRTDLETRVRRDWTREWWHMRKDGQILVTSAVVLNELKRIPDATRREASLNLVKPLELVPYDEQVADLAELYIHHRLMPREVGGDADHLALASLRRCDMLVTWNCRHLANANKIAHIRKVNAWMELPTPLLVTPLELIERI
jgi:hypothetical protein